MSYFAAKKQRKKVKILMMRVHDGNEAIPIKPWGGIYMGNLLFVRPSFFSTEGSKKRSFNGARPRKVYVLEAPNRFSLYQHWVGRPWEEREMEGGQWYGRSSDN